jgi:hypothetical protein
MKKASLPVLALLIAACGGEVAEPSSGAGTALPPRAPASDPGPATAPKAESVSGDVGAPTAIALDGDLVVFTTRTTRVGTEKIDAGGLFVADKKVGPALLLDLDRRGATFDALTTDGASAFVATSDGRVVTVPLMGGDEKLVTQLDAPAVAIATAGDSVYVAYESGDVARVAKAGGKAEVLAKVDGAVRGLVADDGAVYVATAKTDAGAIVRIALATKEAKALATAPGQPCAVVRDAAHVFWTTAEGDAKGSVRRVSLDGADQGTVAEGAFTACALASDASSLYFATTVPGALPVRSNGSGAAAGLGLMRAPIMGGAPVSIAEASGALAQPGAVAVDATHLYWLTGSAVMRLRK